MPPTRKGRRFFFRKKKRKRKASHFRMNECRVKNAFGVFKLFTFCQRQNSSLWAKPKSKRLANPFAGFFTVHFLFVQNLQHSKSLERRTPLACSNSSHFARGKILHFGRSPNLNNPQILLRVSSLFTFSLFKICNIVKV